MTESESKKPRRRHSEEDREKILAEFARSELSQAEYAQSRGISVSTFQNWQRKSRRRKSDVRADDLIPVRLVSNHPHEKPAGDGLIEIELPTGSIIRLARGFDPDEIRTLVKILRESC